MTIFPGSGYGILERRFLAEPAGRAAAGAFGRRSFGRTAPAPASELEVERILARCRTCRAASATTSEGKRRSRSGGDNLAYVATGLSLLALSIVSALPVL